MTVVIDAGYIGMELSSVFAKLVADVLVIEIFEEILPGYGNYVTAVVERRAEALGIDIEMGEQAEGWEKRTRRPR